MLETSETRAGAQDAVSQPTTCAGCRLWASNKPCRLPFSSCPTTLRGAPVVGPAADARASTVGPGFRNLQFTHGQIRSNSGIAEND
eukprot:COSAG02_NODE_7256_length_3094_cov_19.263773_9_plen_86_part_00